MVIWDAVCGVCLRAGRVVEVMKERWWLLVVLKGVTWNN
jgi:hypothetical protein